MTFHESLHRRASNDVAQVYIIICASQLLLSLSSCRKCFCHPIIPQEFFIAHDRFSEKRKHMEKRRGEFYSSMNCSTDRVSQKKSTAPSPSHFSLSLPVLSIPLLLSPTVVAPTTSRSHDGLCPVFFLVPSAQETFLRLTL